MFHIQHVVREEVSSLPFREQSPELRERVRSAQEGSQGAGMAHPFEYDFRGRAEVNQNTWWPEEFQGARYGDPSTPRREDHPRTPRQLPGEVELEGPEGRLPSGTEQLGNRAPGPPLDLLVEIQEPPPQPLRHRLPYGRLPGARKPGKDQVRGGRRVRGGHSGEGGLAVGIGL